MIPEFGAKVICSSKLVRIPDEYKRTWEAIKHKPRIGLYIGIRTLFDGVMVFGDPEYSGDFKQTKAIRVGLVVFNHRENPVYVPFESIKLFSPDLTTE